MSEPLDLRVGDYARLEGSSYTINRAPDLVKASAVEFRYDLVLESPPVQFAGQDLYLRTSGTEPLLVVGDVERFRGAFADEY